MILAGDAAHMINPLSGGGHRQRDEGGEAGGAPRRARHRERRHLGAHLQAYHDEWMALLGDAHEKYYKLKETINQFDDDFFNRLARTVNEIPPEKRTLARVMTSALVHHPTLLPIAAQLFVEEFC